MRFGLSVPPSGTFSNLRVLGEMAREAELHDWDGFFVWDHLSLGALHPLADPWLSLTVIALETEKLLFGPLVTPIFRREPGKLASETVTLDHLSGGRLIMGVGLGSDVFGEISAYGGPLDEKIRAGILDEGLVVLTGLWSGRPFSFEGKYYRLSHASMVPGCCQSPRIPIWVAATWGHKSPIRRAARFDGLVPVSGNLRGSLNVSQTQQMIAYARRFRRPNDEFDVVHFGSIDDLQSHDARALVASYAEIGVTWWIQSVPLGADLDETLQRIRYGPPR
jgi:alkanesulfonate monooxygenase SsuD/methylene tetrahydromethanopterin reductase-like flavin-dependent oxidoreductase (luciferase family)